MGMTELRDDSHEDSKENWVDVVLFLRDEQQLFEKYRDVILNTVPKAKELKAKQKISDWHFRFGSFGADVAFRLRSGIEHKNEVVHVVEQLAAELIQKGLVKEYTFGKDPGWFKDERTFKEEYKKHWRIWWWKIECDEILSELACKVLSYQDPSWAYNYAFHDLFNMFAQQGLNGHFEFQPGKLQQISELLTSESADDFRKATRQRKGNFVKKKVELDLEAYQKTSNNQTAPKELLESWEAKYSRKADENWNLAAMFAMFSYWIM